MPVEDRDYARVDRSPKSSASFGSSGGFGGGTRGAFGARRGPWPMHVILIALCCAVYFLDTLLPVQAVQAGSWRIVEGKERAVEDMTRAGVKLTVVPGPVGPNGIGLVAAVPGPLAQDGAAQLDPVAYAEYALVSPLRAWFQFTTAQAVISFSATGRAQGWEFWRFITYGFLHVGAMHLIFNMMGLWFFAPIVEERYGRRRFLAIFLVATIAGACLFLTLNALGLAWMSSQGTPFALPGLLSNDIYVPLIGASGGVYGIILAAAWLRPNEEVLLMYILPMKLKVLALGLIAMSVYSLISRGANAGGEAAHLGGAIAGWWTAQNPRLLDDFFDSFHWLDRLPWIGSVFSKHASGHAPARAPRVVDDRVIDAILDKVRDKGLASLTERERTALRDATDDHRKRDGRRN